MRAGNWLSFLYVWQLSFSAPLSIASGCIGLSSFLAWFWPGLESAPIAALPALHYANFAAAAACLLVTALLYRNLEFGDAAGVGAVCGRDGGDGGRDCIGICACGGDGWLAYAGESGAVGGGGDWRAGAGDADCDVRLLGLLQHHVSGQRGEAAGEDDSARDPAVGAVCDDALCRDESFGAAVDARCGGTCEARVRLLRVQLVAEIARSAFGRWAGYTVAALVMWTAFASVFSLLLGYSRVPFAAAQSGNYFRFLAAVHPKHGIPHRSLVALGLVATVFCFFSLQQVITMLVVTRILLQFFLQHVGVILLRGAEAGAGAAVQDSAVSAAASAGDGGVCVHPGKPQQRA